MWVCQIRQEGVLCVRVRAIVWNTLKRGGIEKRGAETKVLKGGGGQSGLRRGFLKYQLLYLHRNLLWKHFWICGSKSLQTLKALQTVCTVNGVHRVNPFIYRGLGFLKSHRKGGSRFSCKNLGGGGWGGKHCFLLIIDL